MVLLDDTDTIVALATPMGQSGVGVIRLSGPQAWAIGEALIGKPIKQVGVIQHAWAKNTTGQIIDELVILPFKAPKSYTGQDVIELQGHGSPVVLQQLLQRCLQLGCRLALPGEYTQRAYLNQKMDLSQAEAVMDLISAQGQAMASLALSQLTGQSLTKQLHPLGMQLMAVQASIIASVDFPDEVEEPERDVLANALQTIVDQLEIMAKASHHNRILREGFPIAIVGRPNVGKSSLFNALLATNRAIVSDIAGTTRDVLTETLTLNGIVITLVDTAGIRQTDSLQTQAKIEALGIERSWQAIQAAKAVLIIYSGPEGITPEDNDLLIQIDAIIDANVPRLIVGNKADLLIKPMILSQHPTVDAHVTVSAKTAQGLSLLTDWLSLQVQLQLSTSDQRLCLNQRQSLCLTQALTNTQEAQLILRQNALPIDLATVPLSLALDALNQWTGQHHTEAMLDEVFARFCVGK
jgi:tRNA modification GTPase